MDENREEQQIDLRDYLRVVLKRRWTVIAVFAIIVVTAAIYSFTATPIYQATTRLIIEKENPNVVSIQEVMAIDSSGTDYYQTQYKIIESRAVARDVIKRLKLDENEEFVTPKGKEGVLSGITGAIGQAVSSITSLFKGKEKEGDSGPADTRPRTAGFPPKLPTALRPHTSTRTWRPS
jgi:uncharacterized protein involved in exopolysaccharide biosynthesis